MNNDTVSAYDAYIQVNDLFLNMDNVRILIFFVLVKYF